MHLWHIFFECNGLFARNIYRNINENIIFAFMKTVTFKICALTLSIVLSVSLACSCADSDDVGDSYTTFTGQKIADYLSDEVNKEEYSEFVHLLEISNAWPLMESYGKYTLFMPTNKAVREYYMEKGDGVSPMNPDTLNAKALRKLVFYHLIDGETNLAKNYTTFDFEEGALPTKNMVGRYLIVHFPEGAASTAWQVNEEANIVEANLEMINGVVHVVDHVIEGNNDLLPNLIKNSGKYDIYGEALDATHLGSEMMLIEDESYKAPAAVTVNPFDRDAQKYKYPEEKKYGWTALLEPDELLATWNDKYTAAAGISGIKSVDDMEAYARAVYKELIDNGSAVPVDLSITDRTNPKNALHHFVAYHFLRASVRTDNFVTTYGYVSEYDWFARRQDICDENYRIEQYWPTLAPGALLQCQKYNIINTDESSCWKSGMANSNEYLHFVQAESNKDCQNGYLHQLNRVMAYNSYVENEVLHRRLRMEFRTFFPELVTNDVIAYTNKYNQWHRLIPSGYCKNLIFEEQLPNVYVAYHAANVHHYLYGDELNAWGFFDVTCRVGPIPSGKYEVRFGYHVYGSGSEGAGVTQIYLDGEPCGIPLDMRVTAAAGDIGWEQDLYMIQNYDPDNKLGRTNITGEDDLYGYENDKSLHNRNFMKAPDSYVGSNWHNDYGNNYGTARNSSGDLRYILGQFQFSDNGEHDVRFVQMLAGKGLFDYIEFIPVDLLDKEDQH